MNEIDKLFDIKHHFSDGLYAKESFIPKGSFGQKHVHNYSHLSILAGGRVVIEAGEESKEYSGMCCIEIKAGITHKIIALEDSHWFCIHATDATSADEVDEVLINKGES